MIDAKDCGDFENWFYAQGWYKFYYPTYGDIAGLDDGERDGLVCEDSEYAPPFGILPPGVIPWWFGRW